MNQQMKAMREQTKNEELMKLIKKLISKVDIVEQHNKLLELKCDDLEAKVLEIKLVEPKEVLIETPKIKSLKTVKNKKSKTVRK